MTSCGGPLSSVNIRREFKAGERIFSQGDPGDCAFIIEAGRVQISIQKNGQEFPVSILGEGEIFGEMAILDGLARSASATAMDGARVCVISRDQLYQRIENSDPVVRLLVSILIKRTRQMNSNIGEPEQQTQFLSSLVSEQGRTAIDRVRFEGELQKAFEEQEFSMHYQPIMDLDSCRVVGFEALIRWDSPTLGRVRPDMFMNVIEESSLMIPVGRWLQERAMRDLAHINRHCSKDFFMSINVSGRQFTDPGYVEDLEATRCKMNLRPEQIKLEATERIFMGGTITLKTLEKCREHGYQISLDDFGTGYSSLSYLREISVDNLKIDQSFVKALRADKRSSSIIEAVVTLSKSLGLNLIAEGIEDTETLQQLRDLGCHQGQGYHFARPMPLDQLLEFLNGAKDRRAAPAS